MRLTVFMVMVAFVLMGIFFCGIIQNDGLLDDEDPVGDPYLPRWRFERTMLLYWGMVTIICAMMVIREQLP